MKILFTQWFKATPEVLTYSLYCLYRNLSNKLIDKVILFVDNCEFNNIFNEKLIVVPIQTRLSYKMWMDYADKEYPEDIKILSNSDVYFDESLSFLDQINEWENRLYVLTRKDLTKDGNIIPSSLVYNPNNTEQISHQHCQDAWIYKNKLKSDFNNNYNLGAMHCENGFRISAQESGICVFSLFNNIELTHVDWRGSKVYSEKGYKFDGIRSELPYFTKGTK
jgi:hypothetical protein